MTSRGLVEKDFVKVADFLERAVNICLAIQKEKGKLMKDFLPALEASQELKDLRTEVEEFSSSFDMPGFDVTTIKMQALNVNGVH